MSTPRLSPAQISALLYLSTDGARGTRPFAATTRILIERGLATASPRTTLGVITDAGRAAVAGA